MNLETERKIKFWVTIIVKLLVGGFVVFKLVIFLSDRQEKNKISQIEDANPNLETEISQNSSEIKNNIILDDKTGNNEIKNVEQIEQPKVSSFDSTNDMSIFVFGKDSKINNKIKSQLQSQVFKSYNILSNISELININQDLLQKNLKLGNIDILGNTESRKIDYICVVNSKHTFRKSTINSDITICDLDISYLVYNNTGINLSNLSKSETYTGQGFNNSEALKNAIKQIK
jgi:hypothetical protein